MLVRRVAALIAAISFLVFGGYLWHLYRNLEVAFTEQEESLPTRFYSDVTRVAAPQLRGRVEERLAALGYQPVADENGLKFILHQIEYPSYLLPADHVQASLAEADTAAMEVTLDFDGTALDSSLLSVQLAGKEVDEIFLEPELVATLARSATGEGSSTKREIRTLVKFDDIPPAVWKAIIAIEDQHFMDHHGLDPRGIARAFWVNLRTLSLAQGGSTITAQLVKNLSARKGKNIFRKANELFLAVMLEARFSKEEILERYLNEVYLGQVGSFEVHGIVEGAHYFFGKRLEDLNLAETALMAGLIRGPVYYSPYRHNDRADERQKLVLRKMVETGQIAQAEADAALQMPIRLAPPIAQTNKAPYFIDYVKAELIRQLNGRMSEEEIISSGFRVYTTLDMQLNVAAQRRVLEGVIALEKKHGIGAPGRLEGALIAVDHSNSFIRTLIGGRNYAESTFNRILNMKRQVGSTFKPFVYLAALRKGVDSTNVGYGSAYPTEDAPWTLVYDRGKQKWSPKNYEPGYKGWMTLRTALAHSVNTVAAKLGAEVGIDRVIETARSLGVESDLPAVPALSLGVAEMSPVELVRAYAALANHGTLDELTVIRGIVNDDGSNFLRFEYRPETLMEPGHADMMTDMLQSVFVEGTAKSAYSMGFERPAAGKTGTTNHHRDAWFIGYTPQLTTAVWVGMDLDQPPPDAPPAKKKKALNLTGAGSALPIWTAFMKDAHDGEPPAKFTVHDSVGSVRIDRFSGKVAFIDCPDSQVIVEKYYFPQGLSPAQGCESSWPTSRKQTVIE